jgi:hypothetical protein
VVVLNTSECMLDQRIVLLASNLLDDAHHVFSLCPGELVDQHRWQFESN